MSIRRPGCGTLPVETSIAAADKEYWETEVDTGTGKGDSNGDGIASALPMATTLHNDLTKANLNAWHIWGCPGLVDTRRRLKGRRKAPHVQGSEEGGPARPHA